MVLCVLKIFLVGVELILREFWVVGSVFVLSLGAQGDLGFGSFRVGSLT